LVPATQIALDGQVKSETALIDEIFGHAIIRWLMWINFLRSARA
jgi:hypothetical protein